MRFLTAALALLLALLACALGEAAGYRKEAAPEEEEQAGSGGSRTLSGCANARVGSVGQRRETA
jgi:hypothetical protein